MIILSKNRIKPTDSIYSSGSKFSVCESKSLRIRSWKNEIDDTRDVALQLIDVYNNVIMSANEKAKCEKKNRKKRDTSKFISRRKIESERRWKRAGRVGK